MIDEVESHILQRYALTQKVGTGAYGVVWKAVEKSTQKIVALKKVFDAFNNKTDAQRTYREVVFLKQLKHPNIVHLFSTHPAMNEKDLYMVFEYMETDLHVAIRAKVLEQVHRRYIVYQILKALKYMHSADVIHRDLKPANILLDSQCTVKLADFGLARSVASTEEEAILTEYVATRWFRSPEILIGSHAYSKGVDMWSLGCIMGEMLLGKALFPGSSTLNQIERVIQTLGCPTPSDIDSFGLPYAKELFGSLPQSQTTNLQEMFQNQDEDEIDLLQKLLIYNPNKRMTVEAALEHPFVQQFRKQESEIIFNGQILLQLDDNIHFDIDQYRDVLYSEGKPRATFATPKLHEKLNLLVQQQKQQMTQKNSLETYMKQSKVEESPLKKKPSQQTITAKQFQQLIQANQKVSTSPGPSPTNQFQQINYTDYIKCYQQIRKNVNPQQRQTKETILKRVASIKDASQVKPKERSLQLSPVASLCQKNSFVRPSVQKVSLNQQRVKSPQSQSRPSSSQVYQRSAIKGQVIKSMHQKNMYLNYTSGNRILSNLTNNSSVGETNKPSKSMQFLSKLLKQL